MHSRYIYFVFVSKQTPFVFIESPEFDKLLSLDVVYSKFLSQCFFCPVTVAAGPPSVAKVLWEITPFIVVCIRKSSSVFGQPCQALKARGA